MIYNLMFYGGMIMAGTMFIASVVLFIKLRINKVIGDLTGITAKKEIERIRENNQGTGSKKYRTSKINGERVKVTEEIDNYGQTDVIDGSSIKGITEDLATEETTILYVEAETPVAHSDENLPIGEQHPERYFSLEINMMFINTLETI